jgi:N-methylhydantoinase B/oxoprolinase/acetone carboxylase alpha subunit
MILSGHRRVRPFGLAGGESGELGENAVRRADGRIEKLQGCDATTIEAGGTIIIKTPTGGAAMGSRRSEPLLREIAESSIAVCRPEVLARK